MDVPESELESPCIQLILDPSSQQCDHALVGGKARNLWLLGRRVQCSQVPQWFCITTNAFTKFIEVSTQLRNYTHLAFYISLSLSLSHPSPFLPYHLHPLPLHTYQENHLGSSLHIDSSNLTSSAALIQDKIMAAPLPSRLEEELRQRLAQEPFSDSFVAVRSSGTDEDSATHSFAGQCGM